MSSGALAAIFGKYHGILVLYGLLAIGLGGWFLADGVGYVA